MTERMRIVVPTETGGLDGERSGHFGHAPGFTLVDVEGGEIKGASVLENPPHEHGGCRRTVALLAENGATHAVVAGIGGGPLAAMRSAAIAVYFDDRVPVVRGAVEALLRGELSEIDPRQACSGH